MQTYINKVKSFNFYLFLTVWSKGITYICKKENVCKQIISKFNIAPSVNQLRNLSFSFPKCRFESEPILLLDVNVVILFDKTRGLNCPK